MTEECKKELKELFYKINEHAEGATDLSVKQSDHRSDTIDFLYKYKDGTEGGFLFTRNPTGQIVSSIEFARKVFTLIGLSS